MLVMDAPDVREGGQVNVEGTTAAGQTGGSQVLTAVHRLRLKHFPLHLFNDKTN